MLAPDASDRYLARSAYKQQPGEKAADGTDILFEPSHQDGGVHGIFDAEAHDSASAARPALIRSAIAIGGGAAVGGAFLLARRALRLAEVIRNAAFPKALWRERSEGPHGKQPNRRRGWYSTQDSGRVTRMIRYSGGHGHGFACSFHATGSIVPVSD